MVLHDIAKRSDLFVKASAAADTEIFCHRDLDASYIVAVPDRFEKGVGKTEIQQILNRLFAQKMVNTKDIIFREDFVQNGIQLFRRFEVATEGLFHDYPGAGRASPCSQPLYDHGEH